ncbi:MAG: prolyl oligopeptidase [Sphingomonas bacterium]|nr:prolyl oligopeptidase [Sphingomonas bacterium]
MHGGHGHPFQPPVAAMSDDSAHAEAPAITYPVSARGAVVETLFDEMVADPYRWLENDVRVDPAVRAWVDAQNEATSAYLATLPGHAEIAARLTELWDFERFGIPEGRGGRYFYMRNDGLQNQATLFVREGLSGEGRLLLDPNAWSDDGATALGEWKASQDGRRVAYTVQDGGSDWRTLRVLDVDSGETLADAVRWVKFSAIAWARNGSGFFYSRFPEPEEDGAHQSLNLNHAIYFHQVGTPQASDRLVYATRDRPKLNHVAEVTQDGHWLVISSSEGTEARIEVTLLDLTSGTARPRTLVRNLEHNWQLAGVHGTLLYFVTNLDAPRQRIVAIDALSTSRITHEIVGEDAATLESASLVGDRLIASYLVDAGSEARLFTRAGKPMGTVMLPGIGSVSGFDGEAGDPETFFAFTSFATPTRIYRFDSDLGEVTPFAEPKVGFDPDDYVVAQHFYASKDGVRVPMFVVHRRGLDLSAGAPTILYGYGGFNISLTPAFSVANLAWMEMGGVYAQASIRGGGEYGKSWHDGGRLANKQNSFDDFIAAAEYLIGQGVTRPDKLAIRGGSNGGLLVGAVVNQRPDLFAVALPAVGVMDMLRFSRFTAGRYWIDDYGDPAREADFRALLAYSPYHNIRRAAEYPAILVTTADTDDRVVPGHSFKYAAALQAADLGSRPRLIRIETRAGHGAGKPTAKLIEEFADLWAFTAYWTGMARATG